MDGNVMAALIVGFCSVLAAVVAGVWGLILGRQARKAVGTPNGQGNVVEMLERVLTNQGRHDERLDSQDEALASIKGRLLLLEEDEKNSHLLHMPWRS